jgi:hypothetical protein
MTDFAVSRTTVFGSRDAEVDEDDDDEEFLG